MKIMSVLSMCIYGIFTSNYLMIGSQKNHIASGHCQFFADLLFSHRNLGLMDWVHQKKGKEVRFGGIAGFQQRISGREYKPCS